MDNFSIFKSCFLLEGTGEYRMTQREQYEEWVVLQFVFGGSNQITQFFLQEIVSLQENKTKWNKEWPSVVPFTCRFLLLLCFVSWRSAWSLEKVPGFGRGWGGFCLLRPSNVLEPLSKEVRRKCDSPTTFRHSSSVQYLFWEIEKVKEVWPIRGSNPRSWRY